MEKTDDFVVNPNVIWMYPPKPIDEHEPDGLLQAATSHTPDARIEDGKLLRFSGVDEFSLKIGGTTYEVSTHFSDNVRQSVLEQFRELILSEKLI